MEKAPRIEIRQIGVPSQLLIEPPEIAAVCVQRYCEHCMACDILSSTKQLLRSMDMNVTSLQRKCSMGYWEEVPLQQVRIDKVRHLLAMPDDPCDRMAGTQTGTEAMSAD